MTLQREFCQRRVRRTPRELTLQITSGKRPPALRWRPRQEPNYVSKELVIFRCHRVFCRCVTTSHNDLVYTRNQCLRGLSARRPFEAANEIEKIRFGRPKECHKRRPGLRSEAARSACLAEKPKDRVTI